MGAGSYLLEPDNSDYARHYCTIQEHISNEPIRLEPLAPLARSNLTWLVHLLEQRIRLREPD